MTAFQHVLEYVSKFYRGPYGLDEWRLTLILYLADWKSAIEREQPITDIAWRVTETGPAPDQRMIEFKVVATTEIPPDFSSLTDPSRAIPDNVCLVSQEETAIIDFVIDRVASRNDQELARLVFSTFPLMTQPVSAPLNLVALARTYNRDYRHAPA